MSDVASNTSTVRLCTATPAAAAPPARTVRNPADTPTLPAHNAPANAPVNAPPQRELPPHLEANQALPRLTAQAIARMTNMTAPTPAGNPSGRSSQPSHYSTATSRQPASNYHTAASSNRAGTSLGSSGATMTIELASVHGSIRTQSGSISGFSDDSIFSDFQAQGPAVRLAPLNIHTLLDMATYHRGTTREQLANLLAGVRTALPAQQRTILYNRFDTMVAGWLDRFNIIWQEDSRNETSPHRRGSARNPYTRSWSDRIQNGITPLETNVHLFFPFPPLPNPGWCDDSPTMLRMRAAGVGSLLATNQFSYIHIHAHAHKTGTRPLPRDSERYPDVGRWPGDTNNFCNELERQALQIITERMKIDRPYVPVFFGEYARNFFEFYHDRGAFQQALGYDYVLEDVSWKIGRNPDRSFDAKIFMPRPAALNQTQGAELRNPPVPPNKARVVAFFPNNPAFLAHEINDVNDCVGKGLRLDACLEILRSCFNVSATMDEKEFFARFVQTRLTELGLHGPYTRNLLHG